MNAGQRNCHIAIADCLRSYGLDDLLFALSEHLEEIAQIGRPTFHQLDCLRDLIVDIDQLRDCGLAVDR